MTSLTLASFGHGAEQSRIVVKPRSLTLLVGVLVVIALVIELVFATRSPALPDLVTFAFRV